MLPSELGLGPVAAGVEAARALMRDSEAFAFSGDNAASCKLASNAAAVQLSAPEDVGKRHVPKPERASFTDPPTPPPRGDAEARAAPAAAHAMGDTELEITVVQAEAVARG